MWVNKGSWKHTLFSSLPIYCKWQEQKGLSVQSKCCSVSQSLLRTTQLSHSVTDRKSSLNSSYLAENRAFLSQHAQSGRRVHAWCIKMHTGGSRNSALMLRREACLKSAVQSLFHFNPNSNSSQPQPFPILTPPFHSPSSNPNSSQPKCLFQPHFNPKPTSSQPEFQP